MNAKQTKHYDCMDEKSLETFGRFTILAVLKCSPKEFKFEIVKERDGN